MTSNKINNSQPSCSLRQTSKLQQPLRSKRYMKLQSSIALLLSVSLVAALALVGCNSSQATSPTPTTEVSGETSATTDSSGRVTIESDASVMDSYDWSFSDRDIDSSYDASTAVGITLSDSGITIDGTGAEAAGSQLTITEEGCYLLTGSLSDGSVLVELADDTAKAQLVLDGIDINNSNGPAILIENADKVFITLAEGSQNKVSDGTTHEIGEDENDHDGVIFSHEDISLNGSGSLVVDANYDNGIVGKDDVRITSGNYVITAEGHGIQGKDCIKILDGSFDITTGADGLHSSNDEDDTLGYLGVGGGNYSIAAGDDAFHAESALLIAGGTIEINESYEGYEGRSISITGGISNIIASDDGINAATGDNLSDDQGFMGPGGAQPNPGAQQNPTATPTANSSGECFFEMTGGYLYIKAGGDCLDSNGSFTISGGEVIAECVATGGNGTIDCDSGAVITGGIVASVGPSDMAQGFSGSSTQASLLLNAQTANTTGKELALVDSSGTILYSFTATSSNRSFVFSSPDLVDGESYSITSDGQTLGTTTAALDSGNGMGSMGGMGGGAQGGAPGGRGQNGAPQGV